MERPIVIGKQRGFTYIGLLIAVAIISAVLASTATIWHTMVQRGHEKELLFIGHQFRMALNHYYRANQRYPLRLEELVQEGDKLPVKRHLRKIFVDPMTGKAEWGTVKLPDGQIVGVYSLSEESPLKSSGFRARDLSFKNKTKYSEWVFMPEGQSSVPGTAPNNPQPFLLTAPPKLL